MRWRCIRTEKHEGELRIRRRWLLFPKCINDEWRWFELGEWEEKYVIRIGELGFWGWEANRWL